MVLTDMKTAPATALLQTIASARTAKKKAGTCPTFPRSPPAAASTSVVNSERDRMNFNVIPDCGNGNTYRHQSVSRYRSPQQWLPKKMWGPSEPYKGSNLTASQPCGVLVERTNLVTQMISHRTLATFSQLAYLGVGDADNVPRSFRGPCFPRRGLPRL